MPKEILFPEVEPRYVFEIDCLAFHALADGKPVECMVTAELLMTRFGATGPTEEAMREAYRERRAEIQAIARDHIENGWVDEEGRSFLTTRFTRLNVTFSPKAAAFPPVALAHRLLTEIIGPNAETIDLLWDVEGSSSGRQNVVLQIIDSRNPGKGKRFSVAKAEGDQTWLRLNLLEIWARILRDRSHRLNLMSG